MRKTTFFVGVVILLLWPLCLFGFSDDISLFDSKGKPVAYIAEDLTIYLWSGKPVCYLQKDTAGGFHIYGFNGKHLGWLVEGIARDNRGHPVGGVKQVFSTPTEYEPFKPFKQFKPFKAFTQFPPFRPFFDNKWAEIPLKFFLLRGIADQDEKE